jgi:septum formation topological specificity factor MinE
MSMFDRFRNRRDSARRARAIERALRSANSPAVRNEILAIAQRHYG